MNNLPEIGKLYRLTALETRPLIEYVGVSTSYPGILKFKYVECYYGHICQLDYNDWYDYVTPATKLDEYLRQV
jgi:hypothetical protein